LHDLDENPHSLRRCDKQAAKMQSKGEPKKMSRKMRGICTVTRLRIGIQGPSIRSTPRSPLQDYSSTRKEKLEPGTRKEHQYI